MSGEATAVPTRTPSPTNTAVDHSTLADADKEHRQTIGKPANSADYAAHDSRVKAEEKAMAPQIAPGAPGAAEAEVDNDEAQRLAAMPTGAKLYLLMLGLFMAVYVVSLE